MIMAEFSSPPRRSRGLRAAPRSPTSISALQAERFSSSSRSWVTSPALLGALGVPAPVKWTHDPIEIHARPKWLMKSASLGFLSNLTAERNLVGSQKETAPGKTWGPHHLPLHYAAASLADRFIYLVIEASPLLRSAKATA